jgi:hypothetical protein
MSEDRIEELKRERRVIRAWIRDVTGRKQGRLTQIQAELRALCWAKPAEPAKPISTEPDGAECLPPQ